MKGLDLSLTCKPIGAAGSVKDGAWHAHDAILEMLNLHGAGQQKLAEGPGNFSKAGAAGSPGKPAQAAEAAAGVVPGCTKCLLFLSRSWLSTKRGTWLHGAVLGGH